MKILTRYILKEMIGPTLLGFAFYTSIILMRTVFDLAATIIKQALPASVVGRLLLLSLPHIVVLTVPMSLLFGILIAVGRLSADSEIIAMRALGISTSTIYRPVFFLSVLMFLLNLYLMNAVLPKGNRQLKSLQAEILTTMSEQQVRPRVFFDRYENLTIYVNDVDPHNGTWKGVFLADTRPDDKQSERTTPAQIVEGAQHPQSEAGGAMGQRTGQKISVARTGTLSVIGPNKQVWLNLHGAETHVWDPRKPDRYDVNSNSTQRVLLGDKQTMDTSRYAISFREMNLRELMYQVRLLQQTTDRADYNLAWVEIHKKFSIPFACIAFGVLGLPLGITNRRGGKSSGFSLSIAIIVFYWVMINNGEALAAAGRITPGVGMWTANVILLAVGIYLLGRANRDIGARRSEGGVFARGLRAIGAVFRKRGSVAVDTDSDDRSILARLDITFPNIIDRYVLREFVKVLALVLLSTAALAIIVDYTEIANDIRANHVPLHVVLSYYRFLIFQLLNWTVPISVLVATLVTFGIMSKNNEVTAVKSGGVSLYRVAMPIVFIAVVISALSYLMLDFVLPYSNQRVDAIKHRIQRGKEKASAAANQQRLWLSGKGRYLINFLSYDKNLRELTQVQIFEFHPTEFRLTRRVFAQRVRWNGHAWVFEHGWMRSFPDASEKNTVYTPITQPIALSYKETPDDFATEARTADQMTFAQLRRYIETIRRAGYSAEKLTVQMWVKTSWPALSIVMALIALPFAFKIGKRGALYGIGIALVLGIFYWMVFLVFTKFGEVGNLPPILSAWAANVLFAIAAVYMFLHVET
jgi:LPS export ABC transporter permease LptG